MLSEVGFGFLKGFQALHLRYGKGVVVRSTTSNTNLKLSICSYPSENFNENIISNNVSGTFELEEICYCEGSKHRQPSSFWSYVTDTVCAKVT